MNTIPRIWFPSQISCSSSSSATATASCQPVHQKKKKKNIPTSLNLHVHHLLLPHLSAWHLQAEGKKRCFLVAVFNFEEKEQILELDLLVNEDT